jgi:hypothetical protein
MPNGTRNWMQNLLPRQLSRPDGSWNGRQIADVFIPGDAFRDNEGWRPRGMIAGAANNLVPGSGMLIDPPSWLSNTARGAGSFLSSIGRGGSATMPDFRTTFGRDLGRINEGYRNIGVGTPGMFSGAQADIENRIANQPVRRAGEGVRTPVMPVVHAPTGTGSREGRMSEGWLGSGGYESFMNYNNAIRNRGGALMEN